MIFKGFLAWILFCYQVSCRPLSSELLKEDEKVTRCIVEVISDTLSKPNPMPVSSECSKILKEDERIRTMVRHQNLLKQLEELTHHEETRESSAKEKALESDKRWNYSEEESIEWNEEDNMEKRHMFDKKGGSAEWRDGVSSRGEANSKKRNPSKREEDMKNYEESKDASMEEQHEDKEVVNSEDDTKIVMHESEEEVDAEDKRSPEKRHREPSEKEDPRSKEREEEERDVLKIDELIEKIAKEELEDEEDKRAANEKKHYSKEYSSEEDDFKKRNKEEQRTVKKRVEENASDEETDQFEAEEKGVKVYDSKTYLQETDDKDSLEKKSWDDKRHPHLEEDMDSKKRHADDLEYLRKRHHEFENREKDEEEEDEEEDEVEEEERKLKYEEHEQRNLAEIEKELKKVAERLRAIRRG